MFYKAKKVHITLCGTPSTTLSVAYYFNSKRKRTLFQRANHKKKKYIFSRIKYRRCRFCRMLTIWTKTFQQNITFLGLTFIYLDSKKLSQIKHLKDILWSQRKMWSSGRALGSWSEGCGFGPCPMVDGSGVKAMPGLLPAPNSDSLYKKIQVAKWGTPKKYI